MFPKTREEAIELGFDFYMTGIPCKNGHISKRYTKHVACFDCLKERNKTDSRKEYMREYRKNNPDKIKELNKAWFENNKDHHHKYQKEYRMKNNEIVNHHAAKRNRKFKKLNPEKIRAWKLKRRKAEGSFTENDVTQIIKNQKSKCANCFVKLPKNYHLDHIMPITLGGSNWPTNIQALCPTCNLRKNAKHPDRWAKENGRLL